MDTVSLLMQIEQLQKVNETLLNMVSIAAEQREKYSAIEKENKFLKEKHRINFAKQAMPAHMAAIKNSAIEDWHDEVARLSFLTADSMIRKISI